MSNQYRFDNQSECVYQLRGNAYHHIGSYFKFKIRPTTPEKTKIKKVNELIYLDQFDIEN